MLLFNSIPSGKRGRGGGGGGGISPIPLQCTFCQAYKNKLNTLSTCEGGHYQPAALQDTPTAFHTGRDNKTGSTSPGVYLMKVTYFSWQPHGSCELQSSQLSGRLVCDSRDRPRNGLRNFDPAFDLSTCVIFKRGNPSVCAGAEVRNDYFPHKHMANRSSIEMESGSKRAKKSEFF